jgi:hypothetical protein
MGPIVGPETSVSNHLTERNNPEDGKTQVGTLLSHEVLNDVWHILKAFKAVRLKLCDGFTAPLRYY